MKIIYISITGQTKRFVNKLNMDCIEINSDSIFEINEPYIVIVPTYHNEVTNVVEKFIDYSNNKQYLRGVCGSGNRNFNTLFCFSAKDLSLKYDVPLIHCFEFQGSDYDVEVVKERVNKIGKSKISQ